MAGICLTPVEKQNTFVLTVHYQMALSLSACVTPDVAATFLVNGPVPYLTNC